MKYAAYLSSEDSALLRKALEGQAGERCLEIGAGNGGNLVQLSRTFGLTAGTDVLHAEMNDWREVGANYVLANGASCFRDSVFDLVTFNPPYVTGERVDPAVDGGKGLEVPKDFLRDALRVVRNSGTVMFLLNDSAVVGDFEEICAEKGFGLERGTSMRSFFEELTVYVSRRRPRLR